MKWTYQTSFGRIHGDDLFAVIAIGKALDQHLRDEFGHSWVRANQDLTVTEAEQTLAAIETQKGHRP